MFSSKFTFYILLNDLNPDQILTITNTKAQCEEFYHRYLCMKHMPLFKPWCENRDLDIQDINSWYKYYNEKISSAESSTYKITKLDFNKKELAALLRALSQTPVLGCSFEDNFDVAIRKN